MHTYLEVNRFYHSINFFYLKSIWRPPSLSKFTPSTSNMGLTHFGSEASIYYIFTHSLFICDTFSSNNLYITGSNVTMYKSH